MSDRRVVSALDEERGAGRPRAVLLLALGLALGPLVALGLARFAYSLLLPPMRTGLGWTYTQAGAMNTVNAVGYLAGALAAASLTRRLGERRTLAAGMVIAAVSLAAAGLTADFAAQSLLRLAAGVGSAATFVSGGALVAALGDRWPHRSGLLLSVYTAGAGLGIVVSGWVVQPLLATGAAGWRWSWAALGGLAGLSLLLATPALRRVGEPQRPGVATDDNPEHRLRPVMRRLAPAGLAYLIFGAGYIAYLTFVVAYLSQQGHSNSVVALFWTLLGVAVMAGVGVWGRLLDRLRSSSSLAAMTAVLVAAAVLPLLASGTITALASAVLFGSSFMAVPAAMAHLARRRLPPGAWTRAIGWLTVAFAAGQSIGPALAGLLADQAGGPQLGLTVAAIALTLATAIHMAERAAG